MARALCALICVAVCFLFGCADGGAVRIREWTLESTGATPTTVTLPAHFDQLQTARSTYSLRAQVELPPAMRGEPLTLAIPFFQSRCDLWIDGERIEPIDHDQNDGYRGNGAPRWRIPRDRTRTSPLPLELRIERTWTQSAWVDTVPRLSATRDGDATYLAVRRINHVTAVASLANGVIISLLFAALFAFDRRRTAHGWFALELAGFASYPAFMLGLGSTVLGPADGPMTGIALDASI